MPVELLFALLRNPASTGAVLPSSRTLANAMANAAVGADAVIELGAGTGPVTDALLRKLPGVPLIAVELQASMARRLLLGQTTLQNEFPDYRYGRADWLREQEPSK